jgi:hypothetical protein
VPAFVVSQNRQRRLLLCRHRPENTSEIHPQVFIGQVLGGIDGTAQQRASRMNKGSSFRIPRVHALALTRDVFDQHEIPARRALRNGNNRSVG